MPSVRIRFYDVKCLIMCSLSFFSQGGNMYRQKLTHPRVITCISISFCSSDSKGAKLLCKISSLLNYLLLFVCLFVSYVLINQPTKSVGSKNCLY